MPVRVLLLADTHLGFDHPVSPRVRRRRRGHDFLANYHRALEPALNGTVDLVVHGGDVFNRPAVPPSLVYQAFEPLMRVADRGVPVFVVPGNHERGRIPHGRFARHPGIHVFDDARTYHVEVKGRRVALAGFPYVRRVRDAFPGVLAATAWNAGPPADIALLCVHHCFEGATVGPSDFTFRHAPDVIQGADVPRGLAAVLTGHVHRHQVLTTDLAGRPLAAPVLYPGSVERTAFAEMGEEKGYLILELDAAPLGSGGRLVSWTFEPLPARPMVVRELPGAGLSPEALWRAVTEAVRRAPEDAVLRVRVRGQVEAPARRALGHRRLREAVPGTMNVEVVFDDQGRRRSSVPPTRAPAAQASLVFSP